LKGLETTTGGTIPIKSHLQSMQVPLGTMFSLILLWFGFFVPLIFMGNYFGYKKLAIEVPMAYIIRKEGSTLSETSIINFIS